MVYHHAPSHDAFDVALLEILRTGFFMDPLTRSKVAEMLGTSVSKVTRRVARWQEEKIVIPMLRVGLSAGLVRQGPTLLNIELTADIKMRSRLYSILEFIPMAFLYEVRVGRRKELVCHFSVPPEMVDLVRQLSTATGVGNAYRYETLRVPSAEGLFKTFNKKTNTWGALQQVFKERPH
jgi:DNA-binding Lrp family transcriptional regulator